MIRKKMALFSHYPSIRILTQGTKAKNFKCGIFVQVKGFRLRLDEKNAFCFFGENESQMLGSSILFPVFGISSMWQTQNHMFQHKKIGTKLVFSSRRNWGCEKNDIENFEIFSFIDNFS